MKTLGHGLNWFFSAELWVLLFVVFLVIPIIKRLTR